MGFVNWVIFGVRVDLVFIINFFFLILFLGMYYLLIK